MGGKLSDQQGHNAAQINRLTLLAYENGCTVTNYYMGFGGTNLGDWASQGLTTTYDYNAPVREPGGTTDRYQAVKAIGQFVADHGPALARSRAAGGEAGDGHGRRPPDVHFAARRAADGDYLFVRTANGAAPPKATAAVRLLGDQPHDVTVDYELGDFGSKVLFLPKAGGDARLVPQAAGPAQAADRSAGPDRDHRRPPAGRHRPDRVPPVRPGPDRGAGRRLQPRVRVLPGRAAVGGGVPDGRPEARPVVRPGRPRRGRGRRRGPAGAARRLRRLPRGRHHPRGAAVGRGPVRQRRPAQLRRDAGAAQRPAARPGDGRVRAAGPAARAGGSTTWTPGRRARPRRPATSTTAPGRPPTCRPTPAICSRGSRPSTGPRSTLTDAQVAEGRTLTLGSIDDEGEVYVNGQPAAQSHDWSVPVRVDLGQLLHAGRNVIAVVVHNHDGTGGLSHGATLAPAGKAVPVAVVHEPGRPGGLEPLVRAVAGRLAVAAVKLADAPPQGRRVGPAHLDPAAVRAADAQAQRVGAVAADAGRRRERLRLPERPRPGPLVGGRPPARLLPARVLAELRPRPGERVHGRPAPDRRHGRGGVRSAVVQPYAEQAEVR